MLKKLSKIFLCAIMTVLLVCTIAACGNKETPADETPIDDSGVLQMETKYILSNDINNDNENRYFIFHDNGIGEYRNKSYFSNTSDYRDRTITFKYIFVDTEKSTIACFYDSVENHTPQYATGVSTSWNALLNVSKNILCSISSNGYGYYINEDYAAENLPNYNKKLPDDSTNTQSLTA